MSAEETSRRSGPGPWLAILSALGLLLLLRVLVLFSSGATDALGDMKAIFSTEPLALLRVGQLVVRSLCLEGLALLGLAALSRHSVGARWTARGALVLLLWLNLAGAMTFLVLKTYVKGFQLMGLSLPELWRMVSSFVTPVTAAGLLVPLWIGWRFGREGSVERRVPPARTRVLLGVLGLALAAGVFQLVRAPVSFPAVAHSPITLLLVRALPANVAQAPHGEPTPGDWAPARKPAKAWQALASVPRDFNVVVVVLESVRADVFWPSPGAPPMPRLEKLAPHAAVFTRAYAHEPLTIKGLEAMLFGIYPAPFWETVAGKWTDFPLESSADRWKALGLTTAFIGHGEIPFVGEQEFLTGHGFQRYLGPDALAALDAPVTDRTLAKAFDRFLDEVPSRRFAAVLWPHQTHLPYQLPAPLPNRHPPNSFAAYKDAVASLDDVIGDVADALERRGLSENTVMVLVADHGESFAEHPDAGLAHGDRLYETSTHIPLVLVNPRLFHGERDDRVVQQKDLAPTLAWLAGDSREHLNAASSLFLERDSAAAYLISHLDVTSLRGALVSGRWKYQYTGPVGDARADERLYDLQADPNEQRNVWGQHEAEAEALRRRYFGWLAHWNERWMRVEQEGPTQDRARLHQLLFDRAPEPAGAVARPGQP
ncbi:MAG TPA: sulfatase-like hydrolase/transferase [Myxococcaceae bacterium]|nr:sulfatase-like hydrolase/transferase [Myxococcaceae bacterium]